MKKRNGFNINTLYKFNNSKTFKKINFTNINPNSNLYIKYFKEQITFYRDLNFKNIIKVKDLNLSFILPDKSKDKELNKISERLYINIGFQLSVNSIINKNLIIQLKQKNIISSYSFNIHYNSFKINNENYDGYIVLGEEPHQYLKNIYNENQLYKTTAFRKNYELSWDMHFNKIYYINSFNNEIIIDKNSDFYNQATLNPNSNIIICTSDYEKNIRKDYFNELIEQKKCERAIRSNYIYYYCNKKKLKLKDIKNFPTIYFSNEEIDFIFELEYKDLFIEQNNLIYFLVIFYNYPEHMKFYSLKYTSRWEFGTPFLKKYFFTYDYDNKYIGYYKKKNIQNNIHKNNSIFILIVIIILIMSIFGIYFYRRYLIKKRKISAIELKSNETNGINDINKSEDILDKNSNCYNIEMKHKLFLND